MGVNPTTDNTLSNAHAHVHSHTWFLCVKQKPIPTSNLPVFNETDA